MLCTSYHLLSASTGRYGHSVGRKSEQACVSFLNKHLRDRNWSETEKRVPSDQPWLNPRSLGTASGLEQLCRGRRPSDPLQAQDDVAEPRQPRQVQGRGKDGFGWCRLRGLPQDATQSLLVWEGCSALAPATPLGERDKRGCSLIFPTHPGIVVIRKYGWWLRHCVFHNQGEMSLPPSLTKGQRISHSWKWGRTNTAFEAIFILTSVGVGEGSLLSLLCPALTEHVPGALHEGGEGNTTGGSQLRAPKLNAWHRQWAVG